MKLIIPFLIIGMVGLVTIPKPTIPVLSIQEQRWNSAIVRVEKQSEVRWTAKKIERSKDRYQGLEKSTGIPWQVISVLHNMECGLNFNQHLHNGDSLTKRTWQVPAGRPKVGSPPFTFEESAIDALRYDKMDKVNWKDLTASLDALERYNGVGYKIYHPTVPTPYLWSGTQLYLRGKYVKDGKWSSTAVSSQLGICSILKQLNMNW